SGDFKIRAAFPGSEGYKRIIQAGKRRNSCYRVAVSPLSLPVMQLGFEKYLDVFFNDEDLFLTLMKKNTDFCIDWANAQIDAGATAICYFDPISSPSMIPKEQFINKGLPIIYEVNKHLKGPTAMHMASGRILPILDEISKSGAAAVGVSVTEDLSEIKAKARGKVTVLGNLNGIEMCRWNKIETELKVKEAIMKAAPGGGFILSDNHGEIPYQVPDDTLLTITESVKKWGRYPIADGK
ncbi:hypothetical protein HNV12_28745, partial [Methanococcoides sp. SA1]|nr:hypothetical protein [Methanococcoides sp. SA1]